MIIFHLQYSVYRSCASGLAVGYEQIIASTEAEAIAEAEVRFFQLLGIRSGVATLMNDASQIVWFSRRLSSKKVAPPSKDEATRQTS